MAKWFYGNGFVLAMIVARCSSFARTVIADTAIAACRAAKLPAAGSGAVPIADTSKARRDGSITATGSAITAQDGGRPA